MMSSSPSSASDDCFSCGASPQPSLTCEAATESAGGGVYRKRSRRRAETITEGSEEDVDPNETDHERIKRHRKEQRMQRNRLSAARSRQRKEDMLETLTKENASLRDELARLKSQMAAATSQQGGVAAVNYSNFIVLMKLAVMYLIYTAIFVAATLLGATSSPNLFSNRLLQAGAPTSRPLARPWQQTMLVLPCTRFARSFAAAVMPFALPPSPVR